MTDLTRPISQKVSVADPSAPTHVLKPNADGSINVVGSSGGGDVNLTEVGGNAVTTGAGAVALGTQRTTLASDDPAVAALQAMQSATGPVLAPSAGTPVNGTTASMTGTTSTQVLAAPGSGLRNYVTTIIVCNSHATVGTAVEIRDGDGGTVLMTIPAKEAFGGAVITLPVPLKQPTTATRLDAKNTVTGAAVIVTGVGYTGA